MLEQLDDPRKIMLTYSSIIPNFLRLAAKKITAETQN
jgi:hypothetical protein